MKQTERILRHLRDHGSLSSLEAMQEYGCMRLASRINDLRNQGYQIETSYQRGVNRYGESTKFARYVM